MNFKESESYLLSLGNEVETMKLGLENIRKLLAALGNPETKYLKVQVAGTNGKGSVCAFLDSIYLQGGIRTGVFTSPHLMSITERIRIGGTVISEEEFARLATQVRETSHGLVADGKLETVPTYFEQVTAIALAAFAEAKVELAILETGLGGRYDATTAANAEIAAITRIDLDHQEYLGDTIAEIAAEKAAIIRPGARVALGTQSPEAMSVLLNRCSSLGIIPKTVCESYVLTTTPSGSAVVEFHTSSGEYWDTCLGLAGRHQVENACTAIMVSEILREKFADRVNDETVWLGLEGARHPGRLEYIGNFLLDGAHNIGGARALRAYLDEFVDHQITLVFGAMKDKNVAEIAEILFRKADEIILTQASNQRAMSVEQISKFVPPSIKSDRVVKSNSVLDAITIAKDNSDPNGIILVTGSLYLVGEGRKILTQHSERV